MTAAEMKEYFQILQDKYGSSYHTDEEIEVFLNRGQLDEVIALLPPDGSILNVELNQNTINIIEPLLFMVGATMSSSGVVLTTALQSAINTDYSLSDARVLRVLSIGWDGERPVKYTRHNNWWAYIANTFKAPTARSPRCKQDAGKWIISPIDQTVDLTFSGVRYPRLISLHHLSAVSYQISSIIQLWEER
jgi:hypothetical protein